MTAAHKRALAEAKRLALDVDGIAGVDFGFVYRKFRRTRKQGIRFHVTHKRPLRRVAKDQRLPDAIAGIECDVVEARYAPHAASVDPRDRAELLRPGLSIGSVVGGHTGTLGAFVRDRDSGAQCLLSNWHVLAGNARCQPGDAIVQPGPDDLGPNLPTKVAELLRVTDLAHGLDAALARVTALHTDGTPLGLARPPRTVVAPRVGMRLVKSGRSTGVTRAMVDGEEGSFVLDYSEFGDRPRWMDGVRLVPDRAMVSGPAHVDDSALVSGPAHVDDEVSLNGDSGALFVDPATDAAVALLFGGEDGVGPQSEYALAHPLAVVLERLRAELT